MLNRLCGADHGDGQPCQQQANHPPRSCFQCVYHLESPAVGSHCMLFGEPIYNEAYAASECEGFAQS